MNRRDMIKVGVVGVASLVAGSKAEAKEAVDRIEEERTRQYLDNLPEWDERILFDEDNQHKEYLFTFGCDREEIFEAVFEEDGYALVYSPRHLVQKGHFFDLIYVKIGKKNITRIQVLWKEKGHKGPNGGFLKLEDI